MNVRPEISSPGPRMRWAAVALLSCLIALLLWQAYGTWLLSRAHVD